MLLPWRESDALSGDMLSARGLSKTYKTPSGDVHALKDFSYAFPVAKLTAITGPSGSGKSTLLNLLAGLDIPSTGSVELGDVTINTLTEPERADVRLHQYGFVFQSFNLVTVLSAQQNIEFPMGLAKVPKTERRTRSLALLERFGIRHRAGHLPYKLSGGERQRVSIARALANNPDVLFADEPTGNLDSKSGALVLEALKQVAIEGHTVIVVTHDMDLAENADTVLSLYDGELRP